MGLYRPTIVRTLADGSKKKEKSPNWRAKWKNPEGDGWLYCSTGTPDKSAAGTIWREAMRRAAKEFDGTANTFKAHWARPLADHIADWKTALLAKGNTANHAQLVTTQARAVFDGCGMTHWPNLSASKIEAHIAARKTKNAKSKTATGRPLSIQTRNFYIQAVKQFCRWMVDDQRAAVSPIAHLKGGNVKTDRRHDRRALSANELRTLLQATAIGPDVHGMSGAERELVYRLALETGLRANEIRTLTVGGFALKATPPTVTVQAAYAKNGRTDTLPLRPDLARLLAAWFKRSGMTDLTASAFAMPVADKVVRMLRADLKAAGIDYKTSEGFADFHALRHSFISNLARGGVTPKVAQDLARHSDINLTLSRYTHTIVSDRAAALNALPDLSQPAESVQHACNSRSAG